ncbi:hypothetical protein [Lyngbya confervoides]|uniref:Transposase n=1 Tax=Lyngbya confervoides BDU141951 TaxID=1574623 RepID=A0ABD4SY99_9CYAN|nr:hypothetical protein [Lyngbya confervoides]MCM1981436.1 hypothetical protein [Lyngbya confervoides BDU141951]
MGSRNLNYRAQEVQLVMSLKFHHAKTLSEVPLEVAIDAMTKVWRSCQGSSEQNRVASRIEGDGVIHL